MTDTYPEDMGYQRDWVRDPFGTYFDDGADDAYDRWRDAQPDDEDSHRPGQARGGLSLASNDGTAPGGTGRASRLWRMFGAADAGHLSRAVDLIRTAQAACKEAKPTYEDALLEAAVLRIQLVINDLTPPKEGDQL